MSTEPGGELKHVNHSWDDSVADGLDPVGRLVYRSNILGDDQRVTNTGGGNTSSKLIERDPLSGDDVEVLWVKGSGGDLRTSKRDNFSSLYRDRLVALQGVYRSAEVTGVKTAIEDEMVAMYRHTTFNLNPRASSIDTPLHAFVPYTHVDHMHPNAAIAVAACKNSAEITREIYGDEVLWTPWQRPGFDLGLKIEQICRDNPELKGVILGQHGTLSWADDDKECYELTLEIIERAGDYIQRHDKGEMTFGGQRYPSLPDSDRHELLHGLLPWLRGQVSQQRRSIATVQSDESMLRFVNSMDAPRLAQLGAACPDHFLRTKIKPLYVDWDPATGDTDVLKEKLAEGLQQYRQDYADYYNRCKRPDSPPMRDPSPTVVLVPGVGMMAWGKDKSESRVTGEFYSSAVEVMRGAEAIDEYIALPPQEAFDIEYWALEEAKLRRMPPEKELARRVVVVIGAGSGIGKEVARRVAGEGAHTVCADLNGGSAEATARELADIHGIGVAGTGISSCGPVLGLSVDVTNRESVGAMLKTVVGAYGGVDDVIVTAGFFPVPDSAGRTPDDAWTAAFDVNVKGSHIVADEASGVWRSQGLDGSLVLTSSANAVVPKAGSLAYDTSKAAVNHLVRELAVELAPLVRVNGLAPATVLQGSGMFPRERVISSLVKYGIPFPEDEDSDVLRERLARFYAERTLLKVSISPEDQAEVALLLISGRFGKTTGQIIAVDGGLHEAFLR